MRQCKSADRLLRRQARRSYKPAHRYKPGRGRRTMNTSGIAAIETTVYIQNALV